MMADDLAARRVSGIKVQICGDAHLSNFGVFGSPERRMVFDLNDFDETLPGPWEWDVKRLAASFVVAARAAASRRVRAREAASAVGAYRSGWRSTPACVTLDVWYAPHRRRGRS